MAKKWTKRSASKKLAIVQYAEKHGMAAACERFKVHSASLYNWRKAKDALVHQVRLDAESVHEEPAPVKPIAPSKPAIPGPAIPEPATAKQAITGLGPLIAEVRAKVIEELAEELGSKLGEMVDKRMPEIVSKELRKLLTEQVLPTGQVHEFRPAAKRA